MNPRITIITVCFNAADCIEETILSVINQTYQNIEYIIIDGGSNDGTVDVIRMFSDGIAYWISEPDKGIYDAMNKGIAKATGDFINFMNAGDSFVDNMVLSNVFTKEKNLGNFEVIYGDTIISTRYGMYYEYARPLEYLKLLHSLPSCHQSVFVRTSIMKQRPFNTSYKIAGDFDLLFYLYSNGARFKHCSLPIAHSERISGISVVNYIDGLIEKAQITGRAHKKTFKIKILIARARYEIREIFYMVSPCLYKKLFLRKYKKNPYYKLLSQ